MRPDRRTAMSVGGGLAALIAMALAACAPVSGEEAYGGEPAAENAAAASTAEPDPPAEAEEDPEVLQKPEELTEKLTGKKVPRMGKVVTDEEGWILYRFDADTADPPASNCYDECERLWPPAYTDGNPVVKGIDDELVGTVTRDDGTRQLTINGWPVYRYYGDEEPGQWRGQAVGGKWFVISPNGKKNLTCLPKGTPEAVEPPPADEAAAGNDAAGSDDAGNDDAGDGGYSY